MRLAVHALCLALLIPLVAAARLTVDRAWMDDYDYGHALVTVINDTGRSWRAIEVECVAFDRSGSKVAIASAFIEGPIHDRDERTKEVVIKLNGAYMHRVDCEHYGRE